MDEILRLSPLEAKRHLPERYVRADQSGTLPDQLLKASLCHPLAELQCGSASALQIHINGLPVIVALSEHLTLDVFRDGGHWRQVYRDGIGGPLSCIGSCQTTGTKLFFLPAQRFYGDSVLSAEALSVWLATLPPHLRNIPARMGAAQKSMESAK